MIFKYDSIEDAGYFFQKNKETTRKKVSEITNMNYS